MYRQKIRQRRKFRWDQILRQVDILLIIIFSIGIISSVGACEIEQISLLQMFKQIAICAAGIYLAANVGTRAAPGYIEYLKIKNSLHRSPRQAMQTISPKG